MKDLFCVKDLFCEDQQALALKELEFDEYCFAFWLKSTNNFSLSDNFHIGTESSAAMFSAFGGAIYYKAPLYQQAFDFLLDKIDSENEKKLITVMSIELCSDGSGACKILNETIFEFNSKSSAVQKLIEYYKNI